MSGGGERPGPEESPGGLFLLSPPCPPADFALQLDQVLAAGGCIGFLLELGQAPPEVLGDAVRRMQPVCRERTIAFFLADLEVALQAGVDGALLPATADLAAARRRLGPDRLLGARCGVSRHAAMEAGEAGADFIAFGAPDQRVTPALLEILGWWQELFVLPALALAWVEAERDFKDLRAAGADFLAVPWSFLERAGDSPGAARRLWATLPPI